MIFAAGGMSLIPSFTVIGLVLGGVYALAAIGLVLIYRVSGVLNFRHGFRLLGTSVIVGYDQLTTFIVAVVLALVVAAVLRWTVLGSSMRAVADDPQSARLWGISVDRVTAASWMAGSAMAALAGVLI